jgi:hypothetical protein
MGPPVGLYTALRERPDFIRCIVVYYGIMSLAPIGEETPQEVPDEVLLEFSPLELLSPQLPAFPVLENAPPCLSYRTGIDGAEGFTYRQGGTTRRWSHACG